MWTPWVWALAAILLAAGGTAVTALRSSLLIVGEEGLAARAASAPGCAPLFRFLLFCLENLSTRGAMTRPRRILRRGGKSGLHALRWAAWPARLLDRLGRFLF